MERQIQHFTFALLRHRMSFDSYTRPRQEFSLPRMTEPWNELTDSRFKKCTRFYKKEFQRICDALTLIPAKIVTKTRCTATKELAVFVLLRRWAGAWPCPGRGRAIVRGRRGARRGATGARIAGAVAKKHGNRGLGLGVGVG